jgi:hypothetical protein
MKDSIEGTLNHCSHKPILLKIGVYELMRKLTTDGAVKIEFDADVDDFILKDENPSDRQYLTKIKHPVINKILTEDIQEELLSWWLAKRKGQQSLPQFNFLSTCMIDEKPGLFLIQFKKRVDNDFPEGKNNEDNKDNHKQIGDRISSVSEKLSDDDKFSFGLTHESYYELSNRFAWTWKLADLGIPVVLVYLGFISTKEMDEKIFYSHVDFVRSMITGDPAKIVDPNAWEKKFEVGDGEKKTPFIALLRSLECNTFVQ